MCIFKLTFAIIMVLQCMFVSCILLAWYCLNINIAFYVLLQNCRTHKRKGLCQRNNCHRCCDVRVLINTVLRIEWLNCVYILNLRYWREIYLSNVKIYFRDTTTHNSKTSYRVKIYFRIYNICCIQKGKSNFLWNQILNVKICFVISYIIYNLYVHFSLFIWVS